METAVTPAPAAPNAPQKLARLRFSRTCGPFSRLVATVDESQLAHARGAARVRRGIAFLLAAYALLLAAQSIADGDLPEPSQLFLAMLAGALATNRIAAFVRDWGLVLAAVFAYALAGRFASGLDFTVHYLPQLRADEVLGLGTVPTVWLQEHLYAGRTGPLELVSMALYLSHFLAPLLLGYYMWLRRKSRGFAELMFGLLAVSILAEITFVLAPTAPPWLAAQEGLLPPVHHILKQGLFDLGLDTLAQLKGDPRSYNIVAAVPSMHAAFPLVALLVALRHRLPRWVLGLQAFQVVGVLFAIVYTGEHYVVDALAGYVYATAAWFVVSRALAAAAHGRRANRDRKSRTAPTPRLEPSP